LTPNLSAEVSGVLGSMTYIAGLNWQQNRICYENRESETKDRNTQWGVNPLVKLMIPLGENRSNALLFNYKRTLNDIPYSAISSVVSWKDAYTYTVGNPDLIAPSTDMLMAGLSLLRNKINLITLYVRSHNRIYWQTFQDDVHSENVYTKPINLSGQDAWAIGAEWMASPTKWWNYKLSGRMEILPEDATIGSVRYNETHLKYYFYLNNNFNFSHDWGALLNAYVEPTFHTFDRTYHAVSGLSGRLYKSYLKGKIQLALDFSPFAKRRKMDVEVGQKKITYKNTTPVQYVNLSFTWKFTDGKKVNVEVVNGIQDYNEIKDN